MNTEQIYALMLRDKFVYVGRSVKASVRAKAHRARGIKFDSVVLLAEVPTEDSEDVEGAAIKILAPSKNKTKHGRGTHSRFIQMASISVGLSPSLFARLKRAAASDHRTPTGLARFFIERTLKAKGQAA